MADNDIGKQIRIPGAEGTISVGDELSNMKLFETVSLSNMPPERHIQAEKHKVKLTAHPKGVLVLLANGDTWLVADAAIQCVKKAAPKKPEAKK